jgi:hypothetical protein
MAHRADDDEIHDIGRSARSHHNGCTMYANATAPSPPFKASPYYGYGHKYC